MKKILFIICLMLLFIGGVSAEELNPNVDISEEGYERLSAFMSDLEISMIDQKTYDLFLNNEVIGYQSYIVKETYVGSATQLPRKVSEVYMTVDEYANTPSTVADCYISSDLTTSYCETPMKQLRLVVMKSSGNVIFSLINEWKTMPKNKSFDVMAMRWTSNYTMTSYDGSQTTNGNTSYVAYNVGNGNYKFGTNAIGLSQNLVDSATMIYNDMIVVGTCSGTGQVWATYQHAQANITLATSKLYNFSSSGYGGVLSFYGNASGIYDNTTGMHLAYTCS
ncbi:MAG: hypothetical protein E7171_02820 [Firmicutes bacterium]|nr:hypothetical protein [Bacillota bacterium]